MGAQKDLFKTTKMLNFTIELRTFFCFVKVYCWCLDSFYGFGYPISNYFLRFFEHSLRNNDISMAFLLLLVYTVYSLSTICRFS